MTIPGSDGEHFLQEKFKTRERALAFYDQQVLDHLNPVMVEFISRQSMVFIATADSKGECDCSIRTGVPGFVQVLDKGTLLYPEFRGNGVLASMGNIHENPHVGMVFVDFFKTTRGLHVNGKAEIKNNEEVRALFESSGQEDLVSYGEKGKTPERWVVVEVEEAYIHCSKNIPLLKFGDKTKKGIDPNAIKDADFFKVFPESNKENESGP